MAKIKEFPKEILREIIWDEAVSQGFRHIESEITDTDRWHNYYDMIFQELETGKFYQTSYRDGATECQDCTPFEDEEDMIGCEEVEQKEVVVKKWVSVD